MRTLIARRGVVAILIMLVISLSGFTCPDRAYAEVDLNRTVWLSRTGSKYHYRANCSNMSNPIATTLGDAIARGKEPCKVCVTEPSEPQDPTQIFTDVNSSTYHYDGIAWLKQSGITQGFPDGSFKPLATVARCDMAAFLYRLAGSPTYVPTAEDWNLFYDVDENTPHAVEILWMASKEITSGYPDGTFRPYVSITRCDMAAFLHRMAGDLPSENPTWQFMDVGPETPHASHIEWLAAEGVSTGFPDGSFKPFDTVKRCDMAAFLHRMVGKVTII